LDHFESILHFLLQDGVVKNNTSFFVKAREYLLISSPFQGAYRSTLSLNCWHTFPALTFRWAFSSELLAFPHDNEPIFGSARDDSPSGIILDGHDLVTEALAFERWLRKSKDIVLIILNVEHPDHVFSRNRREES